MTVTTPVTAAVVMARGLGTRMRRADHDATLSADQQAAADAGSKAMMPIGRPFLDHVLNALADGGIVDICLVVGPEQEAVRTYYTGRKVDRVTIGFAVQQEALGTADAVLAAEQWVGDRRFLVINGDNYYEPQVVAALGQVPGSALVGYDKAALLEGGNIDAGRVSGFAIVSASHGVLTEITEKPSEDIIAALGDHAMLSMNCFVFTPRVFVACREIGPSPRGEYEIVDAVRWLVAHGEPVRVLPVSSYVLDLSRRSDVASVEKALRERPVCL